LYHVVAGQVLSTNLVNGMKAPTLNGEEIAVDLTDGVKINQSTVTAADVMATNGVIHIIDTVLVPQGFVLNPAPAVPATVVDIALSNNDFSVLVAALQKANLVGALQGPGPFTVFAPTNAAFTKLLEALNISAADLLSQPDLAKVLLFHVVSGDVKSTDLTNGLMAATLNGQELVFDLTAGVNVSGSKVVLADLVAGNGVVHVIDTVLVPQNFVYQPMSEDTEIPQTGAVSLTPYIAIGIISLAGASLMKRRRG
ncbi:MAG TPA: fasciclin domain-containing protein, partial [Bacillota bacterium]|nr:fasciclin domain-containing protein [Bacillota bacterium]